MAIMAGHLIRGTGFMGTYHINESDDEVKPELPDPCKIAMRIPTVDAFLAIAKKIHPGKPKAATVIPSICSGPDFWQQAC